MNAISSKMLRPVGRRRFLQCAAIAAPCLLVPRRVLSAGVQTGGITTTAMSDHSSGSEALVFDWNKIMTKPGRYIEGITKWQPDNQPVRVNTDWTRPPHYARGTYHVRVLIRKMAKHDDFKFIFNHWQIIDGKHAEATMMPPELAFQYRGTPIARTFEYPVEKVNSVHLKLPQQFVAFDWSKPRDLVGFFPPAFPTTPDSGRLDPAAFPVDIRFTVVVVAPGAKFSGWSNY